MPDSRLRIILSDPARQDLRDIFAFTLGRWGDSQLEAYRTLVAEAFDTLSVKASIGRPRHGYLRLAVGRHHIYYRVEPEAIHVVRVLHQSMEASRHLGG